MRFTDILDDVLGHKSKIKVLRYLLNSALDLTGRELSRIVGIHHRTGHKALKELSSLGIVTIQQNGRSLVYKINNNNLIVEKVLKPIFVLENNLLPLAIGGLLKNMRFKVISAIVFGSVAASSERGTSDIDVLFLVHSPKEKNKLGKELEKIDYDFILKYGNMLSPLILTIDEFYNRLRKKDNLAMNIIQKGKAVFGKSIQEVLILCRRKQ